MNHRNARALLSDSMDGMLGDRVERELRSHLAGCSGCARELRELRAAEALLGRLPASLVARAWTPDGEARLRALTRWASAAPPARSFRWRMPALGAFAAAATAALVWLNPLVPSLSESEERSSPVTAASRISLASLVPVGDTPTPLPYSWRQ